MKMSIKKLGLCVGALALTINMVGFTTIKDPVLDNGNIKELVNVSNIVIKENGNRTEVSGSVTNNNPKLCNVHLDVIYTNSNGNIVKTQEIQVLDIKAKETIYYCSVMFNTDISNTSHKIKLVRFFTYK